MEQIVWDAGKPERSIVNCRYVNESIRRDTRQQMKEEIKDLCGWQLRLVASDKRVVLRVVAREKRYVPRVVPAVRGRN